MPDPFRDGEIKGVVVKQLTRAFDSRGWLAELFRHDSLAEEFFPVMAYISATNPGVTRGPHEHVDQADLFYFLGPSNFKLRLWDNREDSETYRYMTTLVIGQDNPASILIPAGVVHAYQNVGDVDGIVINCPNRLYRGHGRKEEVDEIRHENNGDTIFRMED